uniref:Perlucin2 n=1 Tax=Sinohyriopsis cumingii TaxID=165450 RepID=A0A161VF18_SINCU|nr:perlucin2 [Sinohyriopsis cumingii]
MFKGSMSKLNQEFGYLSEQIYQLSVKQKDGHTHRALPHCEDYWEEYQGSCYYFVDWISDSRSWTNAGIYCQNRDSHLLRIDNQMEFQFIQGVLYELHYKHLKNGITPLSGYWTGANDLSNEGQWVWSLRRVPMRYKIWAATEPNDHKGAEDCGELSRHHDFKMNDLNCKTEIYFICEKLIFR